MHGDGDPNAFIDRALAGLAFCYMALRTGGVEFSTGAHAANNLLIVLLIQPLSLNMPPPQAYDPVMTAESLVGFTLTLAIVEIALRHRAFRTLMGPTPENPSDPASAF